MSKDVWQIPVWTITRYLISATFCVYKQQTEDSCTRWRYSYTEKKNFCKHTKLNKMVFIGSKAEERICTGVVLLIKF